MKFSPLTLSLLAACLVLTTFKASGVVVAGASGGGDTSNNTTSAQMASELGLANADFFNNVLSYSDASAVYLGWGNTINGPRAYALSAMHITFSNTIVINGVTYSVSRQAISGSDLALLTLTQNSGIMPPLPVTNLGSSTPTNNTNVIMTGRGRQRVQNATTSATTSDAVAVTGGTGYTTTSTQLIRWGTNQTSAFGPGPANPTTTINVGTGNTTATRTIFNQPASGQWLSTNEAQAVVGDSGGGLFDYSGNLLGINLAVSGSNSTEAFFGQATYFTDVPTYKTAVESAIGVTLIPEPRVVFLVGLGFAFWCVRMGRAVRRVRLPH